MFIRPNLPNKTDITKIVTSIQTWEQEELDLKDYQLKSIDLSPIVEALNKNIKIKTLILKHNGFRSDVLPALTRLQHVKTIDLSHNNISDENLDSFLEKTKIETVNLDCNNISEAAIESLRLNHFYNKKVSMLHNRRATYSSGSG